MPANTAGYVQTQPTQQRQGNIQGRYVFDATAIVATDYVEVMCGFVPDYIRWLNLTDGTEFEWVRGMTDGSCRKTSAAGDVTTVAAPNGITVPVNGRSFRVSQNATTAAIAASKTCAYEATFN